MCNHFKTEDGRKLQHFQHIMLYYFKKDKNATETKKKICAVYGEGAGTDGMPPQWFPKVRCRMLCGRIDLLNLIVINQDIN